MKVEKHPEKHTPFFVVLEALQESDGCALCQLEAQAVHQYLDTLLYENVTNAGVRRKLVRSRGFCHRHACEVLAFSKGLGTGLIYQDQLRVFLRFLGGIDRRPEGLFPASAPGRWGRHAECPACRIQEESRRRYVRVLARSLGEAEMTKAFEDSAGLCVPHFLLVWQAARGVKLRQRIREAQQAKMSGLLKELEEFCRKQDYRFKDEPFGAEANSWIRAVRMMVGWEATGLV
ncbi:MAG: hypothetical protein J7M19_00155 [Planctomycetes bacterium]|nr:hypothetical protein [Planctomycetota bacterium]